MDCISVLQYDSCAYTFIYLYISALSDCITVYPMMHYRYNQVHIFCDNLFLVYSAYLFCNKPAYP